MIETDDKLLFKTHNDNDYIEIVTRSPESNSKLS